MFSLFKKKPVVPVNLSELKCDMHSHLLPGIDDGARDEVMSLELIKGLIDLGYEKLITTPHVMSDVYKNDEQTISDAYNQVQEILNRNKLPIPITASAEYFLDEHFDQLVQNNTPLLTIHNNWVLVELSFVTQPIDLKKRLFDLQIKGYQPILAHPERYLYFGHNKKMYDELKDAGCFFQLNLLSLTNYYGKTPFELAQYLIKKDYIDFLGTDLHHQRHLEALHSSPQIMSSVTTLLDSGKILNPTL